ncbi:hypothetical protein TNCV_3314731 [Trichonephila clavipes]|nr:hypothetical protein TNCV_3314731 [Trichonephila clavipes]
MFRALKVNKQHPLFRTGIRSQPRCSSKTFPPSSGGMTAHTLLWGAYKRTIENSGTEHQSSNGQPQEDGLNYKDL